MSKPNKLDYRKLSRIIQYFKLTIDLLLILEFDDDDPDSKEPLICNVDTSYVVHHDMINQTGSCLSLRTRAMLSLS